MNTKITPYALGATLYMPATRNDIASMILSNKIDGLRSLVICLEDAVSEQDISLALNNLNSLLKRLSDAKRNHGAEGWPLLFIRPRDNLMAKELIEHLDLNVIGGFVLPKFTEASLTSWWETLEKTHLWLMPTLETEEVFDVGQMNSLATTLEKHPCRRRILALRIGGNDLMNVLALRRCRNLTIYDGPMGYIIKMLVAVFGSRGFSLTAPVCEHIDDHQLMSKELALDIAHGLIGKTAIHPSQIKTIHQALMVSSGNHTDAIRILNSSLAVFKSNGAMCEPATHKRWAVSILARATHYGILIEETDKTSEIKKLQQLR